MTFRVVGEWRVSEGNVGGVARRGGRGEGVGQERGLGKRKV